MSAEQPRTPLTLARLGAELEADPTAVYRHFASRAELVRAMGDRLFGEVLAELPVEDDWQEWFRGAAKAVRRVLLRHPALAADQGLRFTGGPNERDGVRIIIERFRDAGFPEEHLPAMARAFGEFMLSNVVMAAAMLTLPPDEQEFELAVSRSLYSPEATASAYEYEDRVAELIIDTYIAGLDAQLARIQAQRAGSGSNHQERGEQ